MRAYSRRSGCGGALLEVLVAVTLMAVSALGVISAQLWMARGENAVAMSERAALIADSLAEAARSFASESAALAQWNAHAGSVLRRADVLVSDEGDGLSLAIVRWASPRQDSRAALDAPAACRGKGGSADMSCASIAFAR